MSINYPDTPILDWLAWKMRITPVIPKFYWDAYSQEEIIKELCKELDSLAKYNEYLGTEMNTDRLTINQVAETLNELQAGGWFEEYSEIIEAWIRDIDNLEGIVADVLNESGIPDRVTALEASVSGEDGLESRMTTAENDIDALRQADTGLGERIDDAEELIAAETENRTLADAALEARDDALEARLDALIPDIIPETIHEAPIMLRIPTAYDSNLIEIPEGMCVFGGDWDAPLYTAACLYHQRDNVNGAETIGSIRIYRNSDRALISEYNLDFGHAAQAAYDWVTDSIIVTVWRYNNTLDQRIFIIPCNADGTLQIANLQIINASAAGNHIAGAGRYTDQLVYTIINDGSDEYVVQTAASFDSATWETLFTFDRTAASNDSGWLQSFLYARDIDRFLVLSSHHTHVEVFNPNSGLRERTIQIDGALNFIAVEEMQAIDFRGTTLYMMNSQNYYLSDNVYQRHSTVWAADLTHLQNFKESIYSVTQNVLHVELSTAYDTIPNIDWTPRGLNQTIKYRMPRDLVALQYYPISEKHIHVMSTYVGSVIPLVNIGYAYVQFDSDTFVNSNALESIGGWYIVNTRCDWQGIGSTQWNINDAAIAQWPQTRAGNTSLHAWIVARRGADIRLRAATINRDTSAAHVWADCDEATLASQTSGFDQYTYLQRTEVIVLTTRTS